MANIKMKRKEKVEMGIEKKIHYCWFGEASLPELALKCIDSWKTFCPNYEIVRWDERNFDLDCCDFVREAYKQKKWAFVSDYARFWILYHYGGIYFDTDVELIAPIDDIIAEGPYMGLEKCTLWAAPGLGMAAYPDMPIYREVLEYYASQHFWKNENSYRTVVSITTEILLRHGSINSSCISEIAGIRLYPTEYFCPMNRRTGELAITENTRSIHHFTASWTSRESRRIAEIRRNIAGSSRIAQLGGSFQIAYYTVIIKIRRARRRGLQGNYLWIKRKIEKEITSR